MDGVHITIHMAVRYFRFNYCVLRSPWVRECADARVGEGRAGARARATRAERSAVAGGAQWRRPRGMDQGMASEDDDDDDDECEGEGDGDEDDGRMDSDDEEKRSVPLTRHGLAVCNTHTAPWGTRFAGRPPWTRDRP